MFVFTHHCVLDQSGPLASDAKFEGIKGAYVNVYVSFLDFEGARVLSRFYAERVGWIITQDSVISSRIERETVSEKDQPIYDEATEYGYCAVFNMWRQDAPDEEKDGNELYR